eukprot:g12642.t1
MCLRRRTTDEDFQSVASEEGGADFDYNSPDIDITFSGADLSSVVLNTTGGSPSKRSSTGQNKTPSPSKKSKTYAPYAGLPATYHQSALGAGGGSHALFADDGDDPFGLPPTPGVEAVAVAAAPPGVGSSSSTNRAIKSPTAPAVIPRLNTSVLSEEPALEPLKTARFGTEDEPGAGAGEETTPRAEQDLLQQHTDCYDDAEDQDNFCIQRRNVTEMSDREEARPSPGVSESSSNPFSASSCTESKAPSPLEVVEMITKNCERAEMTGNRPNKNTAIAVSPNVVGRRLGSPRPRPTRMKRMSPVKKAALRSSAREQEVNVHAGSKHKQSQSGFGLEDFGLEDDEATAASRSPAKLLATGTAPQRGSRVRDKIEALARMPVEEAATRLLENAGAPSPEDEDRRRKAVGGFGRRPGSEVDTVNIIRAAFVAIDGLRESFKASPPMPVRGAVRTQRAHTTSGVEMAGSEAEHQQARFFPSSRSRQSQGDVVHFNDSRQKMKATAQQPNLKVERFLQPSGSISVQLPSRTVRDEAVHLSVSKNLNMSSIDNLHDAAGGGAPPIGEHEENIEPEEGLSDPVPRLKQSLLARSSETNADSGAGSRGRSASGVRDMQQYWNAKVRASQNRDLSEKSRKLELVERGKARAPSVLERLERERDENGKGVTPRKTGEQARSGGGASSALVGARQEELRRRQAQVLQVGGSRCNRIRTPARASPGCEERSVASDGCLSFAGQQEGEGDLLHLLARV